MRKHSKETKLKMKIAHLGKKYKPMSLEGKANLKKSYIERYIVRKIKLPAQGKHWKLKNPRSPEYREKIRKLHTGKKFSEERKKRMSLLTRSFGWVGDKNPSWKGGKNDKAERSRLLRISGGFHSKTDWENLKSFNKYTCLCCKRKEPEIKLTKDHIIPVTKGGSDSIENIQPLCGSCNSFKHVKIIKYE